MSRRLLLLVPLMVVAVVVIVLAGLVAAQADEALPGTRVGALEVGGLGAADLRQQLGDRLAPAYSRVLVAEAGDSPVGPVPIDPAALGARLDLDATVAAALSAGHDSLGARLGAVFGGDRSVPPAAVLDEPALAARVREIALAVDTAPDPGGVSITPAATVTETAPVPGRQLDQDASVSTLRTALLSGVQAVVQLPVTVQDPPDTGEQVGALADRARAVLAQPFTLTSPSADVPAVTLAPTELAGLLSVQRGSLQVDRAAAVALLEPRLAELRQPARNASLQAPTAEPLLTDKLDTSFSARPASTGPPRPGQPGRAIDTGAAVDALSAGITAGAAQAALPLTVQQPAVTEADLAGIDQVIGSFTTKFPCCRPRATNIRRMAEIVDGTVVGPGETFSLNGLVGERTRAKGFVADGAIVDGELVDEVGGGVSQFSTTMYNAAWFAGLPIVEHQPHSRYISRYPPGREATLYFKQIDNRWSNDTGKPVLVTSHATGSSVTVTLYGHTGDRRVVSVTGPRSPRPDGGFRVAWSRTVSDAGAQVRKDNDSWTYQAPLEH